MDERHAASTGSVLAGRQIRNSLIGEALRDLIQEAVRDALYEVLPAVLENLVPAGAALPFIPGEDAFLTVAEVSKLIRLPPSTVYDLIRRGDLPGVRVGRSLRVPKAALGRWLAEGGTRPRKGEDTPGQKDPFKSLRE